MRLRLTRVLLRLAGMLLVAEVLYLLAANVYLNSGRLQARVGRSPERFSIRWGAARTLWPGEVRLRDVEMRGRSPKIDWYAHLDSVGATFRLGPLLGRTVHLHAVTAAGVDYRQRRRAPGAAGTGPESDLPPLPDVTGPAGGPPRPRTPGRPGGAPWTIVADDIRADIALLWFDRFRLAGPMALETAMTLVVRGPMEFPRVRLTMTRGRLAEGGRAVLGGLDLGIETSLAPFVPKGLHTLDVIRMLPGRFRVDSDSASLFFLEAYFRKAPWLHFNGHSVLHADLVVGDGRLQPGSILESRAEAVDIDFLDRKLTGRGHISARVDEADGAPLSHMEVRLDEFSLAVPDRAAPFAHGRDFKVSATSPALDLADPFASLQVTADLPEAVIPDLTFYNRFIPSGSGLVVRGGQGRIQYHIEGNQEERSAHGSITLSAEDLAVQFEKYPMRGDVTIHTRLRELDPREGRFDISGTTIDLRSRNFPWTATLSFPRAEVRYTEPLQGRAETTVRMTDTRPLVAMFDAQKDISRFVQRLMTIRDIRGSTSLSVNADGCAIDDLEIAGHKFLAMADLALRRGGKEGILYLKLHIFSVGVAFDHGKKDLDLVRARKWFERQRAARRRKPPGG